MVARTAFGTVHGCQIESCDREAQTSQYVDTPRGRGELATCFPCAEAIRVGQRSRGDGAARRHDWGSWGEFGTALEEREAGR